MSEPFKRGDFVNVTYGDRTVEAMVTLASPNGRSLLVMFEAMLGGHAGVMPILQVDDGTFISLIESKPVKIERQQ